MDKTKFFDQTFKMLLALMASAWVIYFLLLIFASDAKDCMAGTGRLFTTSAWLAGVSSAPPLVYGLFRFIAWPNGPKTSAGKVGILVIGASIFVTLAILFALAISKYGCQ